MFEYFFKIAFRNIWRNKIYAIINLVGLATGIAVFSLICLYILDELNYDTYHKKSSEIYRVVTTYENEGIGEKASTSPFPLAEKLKAEYPDEVITTVRLFNFRRPHTLIVYNEKGYNEKRLFFVDSTIFKIFDYQFILGDSINALNGPNKLVLTESTAKRYFGEDDPLGKILLYEEGSPFEVTGVIKDVPNQSHFRFDMLASMSTLKHYGIDVASDWVWNSCWTYVLLSDKANLKNFGKKLPDFVNKYFDEDRRANISLSLQKLKDIHLKSSLDYEIERNSNIAYLYILLFIAIFILIIAYINFMNLTIAGSLSRGKEVGIKKVFGAQRHHIIFQFLSEAFILTSISVLIGLFLAEQFIPLFDQLTSKEIRFKIFLGSDYFCPIVIASILFGILGGLYPAITLSSFQPIKVLTRTLTRIAKNPTPRKVLIIVQYTISVILLILTIVNISQLVYLRTADLGFNKDQVVIVPVCNNTPVLEDYDAFKADLLKHPEIVNMTAMSGLLGAYHETKEFTIDGFSTNLKQSFPEMTVGSDFVKTFEIKVLAGTDFSEINKIEPTSGVLINEALAKYMGCQNYNDAINRNFRTIQDRGKVIGVINDFNVNSLHTPLLPFVLTMPREDEAISWITNFLAIRVAPDKLIDALKIMKYEWKKYSPVRPFEPTFLDSELDSMYKNEDILVKLTVVFTFIAVFIASLGILGLTSFLTQQRTKEIGMRKVLGSSIYGIARLLSLEFLRLIIIANAIAWPIAYVVVNYWLDNFAYQIHLQLWMFLLAAFIAVIFAISMVAIEAFKAAISNPVSSLRYE